MAETWKHRLRDAALVVPAVTIVGMAISYGRGMERITARLDRLDELHAEDSKILDKLQAQLDEHGKLPIHPGAAERLVRLEQSFEDLCRRVGRLEK